MPLPQIPNTGEAKVVEPAVGKTYPDWFVTGIRISADASGTKPMSAQIQAVFYDYATGEAAPPTNNVPYDKRLMLMDLEALATERAVAGKPALATAMNAIIAAVVELLNE